MTYAFVVEHTPHGKLLLFYNYLLINVLSRDGSPVFLTFDTLVHVFFLSCR